MRDLLEKQNPTQIDNSISPARSVEVMPQRDVDTSTFLQLQSTVGNQEVLKMLQSQEHGNEGHEQFHSIQKKSLGVSSPTDADEKEADEVARKVVAGQPAEIHGTGGTVNRQVEGTAETTPAFQSKLESSDGGGQSLDDSTRLEMESKMGADFSDVKIHVGSEADKMSESINAKAFTHGRDVYFSQGEYRPDSKQGKELLAHELTHTVQQNSEKYQPKLQRKIIIAGAKHEPTEDDKIKYGKELIEKLHNNGGPPDYSFANDKEFDESLRLRKNLINTMVDVTAKGNNAARFGEVYDPQMGIDRFTLPTEYWVYLTGNAFRIKEGKTPAKAVRSIFENTNKETHLDCLTMMVAAQYKSMLDSAKDDDAFNAMFPGGKGLIISQAGQPHVSVDKGGDYPTATGKHPFEEKKAFPDDTMQQLNIVIDPADPTKDLLPGDWVYFTNVGGEQGYQKMGGRGQQLVDEYLMTNAGREYVKKKLLMEDELQALLDQLIDEKKRTGKVSDESAKVYDDKVDAYNKYVELHNPSVFNSNAWQGEHAVYLGDKKFSGFGISGTQDYNGMLRELFGEYMKIVKAYYEHPYFKMKYGKADEDMTGMKLEDFKTPAESKNDSHDPQDFMNKPRIAKIMRLDY
jgi:hypothetical protein